MVDRSRRHILGATAGAATVALISPLSAMAQTKEVKVAVLVPLSGAWARSGEFHVKGAELAIKHINAAGGIKALGGAKMKLVTVDSGDTTEKAKNAAQRLVAQEPDVVAGTGAYVSSFTLAATEVTERAKLPWLTLSYSEQITSRGYKYVFQTSMPGGAQAENALPVVAKVAKEATGKAPKTVGIIMDNTASPASFTKPMREGGFAKLGMKLVVDEIYTPPLSDATSMVQKVRNARPDLLLVLTTNVPDSKMILEKMNEMGVGKGRIPVLASGSSLGMPELLKVMDKSVIDGVMLISGNWGGKGEEQVIADWRKTTGEPWMTQDAISTYGDMWVMKEAIEMAGSADREKVAQALRTMDITGGPARFYPGDRIKFDAEGRRVGADMTLVQWQDGEPKTVYPPALAAAKVRWPKRS
jgi:branched-chain amino acid transport system substrate-binding protein